MKNKDRAIATMVVLAMMVALCACGNNGTTNSAPNSYYETTGKEQLEADPLTAEKINAAFIEAGYRSGRGEVAFDISEYSVSSHACYQLVREYDLPNTTDSIEEYCVLLFCEFSDTRNAEDFYNTMLESLNGEDGDHAGSFVQTNIAGGKRAVSKTPSSGYEYGESYLLSRQSQYVILLYMDWDNFKDANVGYDYLPEEIVMDFGF